MSGTVVVGLQWGDEAKGKVVDYLSQNADYVVRFNGGNNAGHTVVIGDEVFKFHIVPVGMLHPQATSVVADGVVIDPKVLLEELDRLAAKGIDISRLRISGNAHVIMPYHRLLDQLEENRKADKKIGTTGRGIGPCYADKISRTGIRIYDLVDPDAFGARLAECLEFKNLLLTKAYGQAALKAEEVYAEYSGYAERIAPLVCDTSVLLHKAASNGKKIVFEGAHGTLLDIDHGTYPYCTSSHVVAGGACVGTGIGPTMISGAVGVAKAYTTRVGEGWFPTEQDNETGEYIRERGKEYGTTTGRPRRCGWFDAVAVRYSARLSNVDCMCVISLDVLSGLDEVRICSAYRTNGKIIRDFPTDAAVLREAMPVYEDLPGWKKDISGAQSLDDLPEGARDYLKHISEVVGVKVGLVSVGRRREQTIVLEPLRDAVI